MSHQGKRKYNSITLSNTRPQNSKKPKHAQSAETSTTDHPSINDLKRHIRNAKRVLNKTDLLADTRIVQERALAGYEGELAEEMRRRQRSEMIRRYHFVRFLDRKSATKDLSRLERKQQEVQSTSTPTSKDDLDSLAARIHTARVNLNYTIYYPLTEKYVSLYAEQHQKKKKRKDAAADQDTDKEKEETSADDAEGLAENVLQPANTADLSMWRLVEKCMADETLGLLREGKLDETGSAPGTNSEAKKSESGKAKKGDSAASSKSGSKRGQREAKAKAREDMGRKEEVAPDDDDASDGGFFEE